MTKTIPSAKSDVGIVKPIGDTESSKAITFRDTVRATVRDYFIKLDGMEPANIYELFLAEVELPLREIALQYCS